MLGHEFTVTLEIPSLKCYSLEGCHLSNQHSHYWHYFLMALLLVLQKNSYCILLLLFFNWEMNKHSSQASFKQE